MKFLIIVAAIVACGYAAPTTELEHPSPINPSVLVEVKPKETESKQNVYTTTVPDELPHHITKRDHKPEHETKPKAPEPPKKSDEIAKKPAQHSHHEPPKTPTTNKKPAQHSHHEPPKAPTTNKRKRRHTEIFEQPQTLTAVLTETTESTKQVFQKPQTLPAILIDPIETSQQHKRDIPVPLVPKHQHPEESTKDSSEEKKKENSKTIPKENHPNKDQVQVEDLSETKPLHAKLNLDHASAATSNTAEHKPVTLIEHPFVRPKPVPVAELFARGHDN